MTLAQIDQERCYMCDAIATSREHVPPKCIFPTRSEMNGEDYRKNLITVPSCDAHNSEKSHDDEFLMVSLAGLIGNNTIGYRHKFGKVNRAIKRSSQRLLDKAFLKKKKFLFEATNNEFFEIIWGTPDHLRLERCFQQIAFALYKHKYGAQFKGTIKVLLGYLLHGDKNSKTFIEFIKHRASLDLKDTPREGENQDVFYYQTTGPDQSGLFMMRLVFYGGLDIYIAFLPEETEIPFHLGIELMKNGIQTVIELDGTRYEFNKK